MQYKGLRVTVVSTVRSQPPMVADELRRQADNFIELQDLQGKIAREPQWREGDQRNTPNAAPTQEPFSGGDDDEEDFGPDDADGGSEEFADAN